MLRAVIIIHLSYFKTRLLFKIFSIPERLERKNSLRSIFLAQSDQSHIPRADTTARLFVGHSSTYPIGNCMISWEIS